MFRSASIGEGEFSFILTNFDQINETTFLFSAVDEYGPLTTFTINTSEFDVDEFKMMILGTWPLDGSEGRPGSFQKVTWIVPVVKILVRAAVVIVYIVKDHCDNAIAQARANCSTPPCEFIAELCSGSCINCSGD